MKTTRTVPELEFKRVEHNKKSKMFSWYRVEPRKLGEMQYTAVQTWVTDDGLTFRSPDDVLEYFKRREADQGRIIEPGEYSLDVESVTQRPGSLVITTRGGDTVTITYAMQHTPNKQPEPAKRKR